MKIPILFYITAKYHIRTLERVDNLTRNKMVDYYTSLIFIHDDSETLRVNKLILSKWKPSGLTYIKEKAWKKVESLSEIS